MARKPNVRVVQGRWFSEAGGRGRYFGKITEVSREKALSLLWAALDESKSGDGVVGLGVKDGAVPSLTCVPPKSSWNGWHGTEAPQPPNPTVDPLPFRSVPCQKETGGTEVGRSYSSNPQPHIQSTLTVDALADAFLSWLKMHRSIRTLQGRSEHLARFRKLHGQRPAASLTASDLERFLSSFASADYAHKHEVSIKAMIAWGVRFGHLAPGFKPFATMEPVRPPAKILVESDLPTPQEVQALIAHAIPELADLLLVQHATGARTGELRGAKVGDYQARAGQIVLKHHKREKTMRNAPTRAITLNATANAVVARLADGRPPEAPLFAAQLGGRWQKNVLSTIFIRAREKAGVRESITPYSLRHLWISEALMVGVDVLLVARMAGTSIAMIEKVYGRFRTQSLNDAQAKLDAMRRA